MSEWQFTALGSIVEVRSELAPLETRLDALLGGYESADGVGPAGLRYRLGRVGSHVQLLRDDKSRYLTESGEDLLDYLQLDLYRELVARVENRWLVHAAALARGTRVVVLAGPSNAGKSTLCRGLMADGWTYLSEEIVSFGDRDFDALRRPLHLENPEQARGIPRVGAPVRMRDDLDAWIASPPKSAPRADGGALGVAALVRIQYRPGRPTRLIPLSASAALEQLWACRMNTGLATAELACRIVAQTPCYRLDSKDLPDAIEAITSLDIA